MQIDSTRSSFGFACDRSLASGMLVAHQHDDIEFNLSPSPLTYRIDGELVALAPGTLSAFWGARPHQLIVGDGAVDVRWLTVPLEAFLSMTAPDGLAAALLRGEVLALSTRGQTAIADRLDEWRHDLADRSAWVESTVRLEIEAFLRRLDFREVESPRTAIGMHGRRSARIAGEMASFVSSHSTEPITVDDVARAVHLHPGYAMTLFKRAVGTTIGSYLAQCRIAHAQRLLITTELGVHEIGLAVGFQSVSQFYDRFKVASGTSPAAYRRERSGPA